jgi:hypothetical protein
MIMQFEGAVIREQGVTFAVVVVKRHVVDNPNVANQAIDSFRPAFPGLPIVLMGQDSSGRAKWFGRQDIARFLAKTPLGAIPWRHYSMN